MPTRCFTAADACTGMCICTRPIRWCPIETSPRAILERGLHGVGCIPKSALARETRRAETASFTAPLRHTLPETTDCSPGSLIWGNYNQRPLYIGAFDSESEADQHVTAVGDVVFYGSARCASSRLYTARVPMPATMCGS